MGLFGKKGDNAGDDSNRSALFGGRSKNKSPAPQATNPYAQPSAQPDPYAQSKPNPYASPPPSAASNSSLGSRPGGYSGYGGDNKYGDNTSGGYGDSKSSGESRYGGASGGGYGANRYGAQGGYGADRYGNAGGASNQASTSRYGASGYGGLGGDRYGSQQGPQQDDENRTALFGGAQERQQDRGYGAPPSYSSGYGGSNDVPSASDQGYGGAGSRSQDRQLTAEEEEEEEVNATKQQIRFVKQESVAATRNALRLAQQAEETGRDTLARLGVQGEHIYNTEKNLDLAHNQNKLAEDKAKELKTLNKSMFAVHVANPFTAGSRRTQRDQAVIDRHLDEKEAREATRRVAYDADQRMQKAFKDLSVTQTGGPKGKNLAERAKYQFEADSEDDEMENEIDSNLDALSGAAGRLNALAKATGKEIDSQNQVLDRIGQKSDKVDVGLAQNKARLDRIAR